MFTDQQTKALASPLSTHDVDSRDGPGRQKLDYVSHEHVVRTANEIFGYGGWSRETLDMVETGVVEKPPKEGRTSPTFVAHYRAKVRVTVYAGESGDRKIIREGWGGCSMEATLLTDAVENGIKGAETDAMKRAFLTFGDQFGLALYDKKREHVTSEPPKTRGIMSRFSIPEHREREQASPITGEILPAQPAQPVRKPMIMSSADMMRAAR